jgi:FkbM family methyltransferase
MEWLKDRLRKVLGSYLYKSAYNRAFFTLGGLVVKELRVVFRQFFTWRYPIRSVFRVTGTAFSALLRLILGRSLKYSFSFTGEDRIIEGIIKPLITEEGFYVDVGCNHPVFLSNTYLFYRRGWKGICVDPNQDLIDTFALFRPRDVAVCALVSDSVQERDFYLLQNNVLSTTETFALEEYQKEGLQIKKTRVVPRTLTQILDEHNAPPLIDFLSIDAEEHDFNVLKSLDFQKYTPKLIVLEDETYGMENAESHLIGAFLREKQYELVGFVLKNMYFVYKG